VISSLIVLLFWLVLGGGGYLEGKQEAFFTDLPIAYTTHVVAVYLKSPRGGSTVQMTTSNE
jgi:hypothetical protein